MTKRSQKDIETDIHYMRRSIVTFRSYSKRELTFFMDKYPNLIPIDQREEYVQINGTEMDYKTYYITVVKIMQDKLLVLDKELEDFLSDPANMEIYSYSTWGSNYPTFYKVVKETAKMVTLNELEISYDLKEGTDNIELIRPTGKCRSRIIKCTKKTLTEKYKRYNGEVYEFDKFWN